MRLGFALTGHRSALPQCRMAREIAGEIRRPAVALVAGIFFAVVLAAQAQESVEPDIVPSLTEPPAPRAESWPSAPAEPLPAVSVSSVPAPAEPLPSSEQAFPPAEPLANTSYTVAL